jgi:hypothetical protein
MGIEDERLLNIDKLVDGMVKQVIKDVHSPAAVAANVANVLQGPMSDLIEYTDELSRRVTALEHMLAEE